MMCGSADASGGRLPSAARVQWLRRRAATARPTATRQTELLPRLPGASAPRIAMLWKIRAQVRIIEGLIFNEGPMFSVKFRSQTFTVFVSTLAAIAIGAAIVLSAGAPLAAEAKPAAKPEIVPSDPARDLALKQFLQKRYRIPNINEIEFGPLEKTPFPGLYGRMVKVTNGKQSATVSLFTDREETKAIIGGRYIDLKTDPWERVDMSPVHLGDRPEIGPSNAPVTVIEFADFECPFCARAFGQAETLVNSTYKGKLRLIYKYYPLNAHPWARTAALGAECARAQNPAAFWDFARYFYSDQGNITAANVKEKIDAEAKKLGLDAPSLNACMAGKAAAARVAQDQSDGQAVHVSSTPTFFINGVPVVGLLDSQAFDYVINSALKGSTKSASR
jgi:protein-disulfide isomerase